MYFFTKLFCKVQYQSLTHYTLKVRPSINLSFRNRIQYSNPLVVIVVYYKLEKLCFLLCNQEIIQSPAKNQKGVKVDIVC